MKLVYSFIYTGSHNEELLRMCKHAKDLYNQSLYIVKQELKENNRWLSYYDLDKIMKTTKNLDGDINYYKLKSQTSQQILKKLSSNISAYIKSIKDWSKNKNKYKGKPNFPKYKDKTSFETLVYTNQNSVIKNGYLFLSKTIKIRIPQYDKYSEDLFNYNQVTVKYMSDNKFKIYITYDKNCINTNLNKDEYMSIDLGVDNLCTIVNTVDGRTKIVNGKQIKSINQYYNKQLSKHKSILETNNNKLKTSKNIRKITAIRNNKINDLFHKISRWIINMSIDNGIGNIVVGYNRDWKDSIRIGHRNNQTFVSIPHLKLIQYLDYKCKLVGINLILHEEGYTSKCDSLTLEKVEKHDVYSGKRIKRGLFQSGIGKLINADVNGSINILRKVVDDSVVKTQIINSGLLFNPIKYNNLYNLNCCGL